MNIRLMLGGAAALGLLGVVGLAGGGLVDSAFAQEGEEPPAAAEEAPEGADEGEAEPEPEPDPLSGLFEDEENDDGYSYNAVGKRDPFRSFILDPPGGPGAFPVDLGPLQEYELDRYKLVGVVWGMEQAQAMVEDPDGIGHVITVGALIGKNWGTVTEIKPDEVIVTEEYRDDIENRLIVTEISMPLYSLEDRQGR